MINPQWLELPMSRTISMVPKMFEPLKFDCITNWPSVCQRTDIFWHSLAYADALELIVFSSLKYVRIRCYSLSTSKSFVLAENFSTYANNGPYAAGSFDERISNGLFARSKSTVRYFYGGICSNKLWALLNELTYL